LKALMATAEFLAVTTPVIGLTTFFTSYLLKKGYFHGMSKRILPILTKFRVNNLLIASALISAVSPVAGYTLLAESLRQKMLDERNVIAASFMNSFPTLLNHLPSLIPILAPIGLIGLAYLLTRVIVSASKSLMGIIYARKRFNESSFESSPIGKEEVDPLRSTIRMLVKVIPVMGVTFFVVCLLTEIGFLDKLAELLIFIPLNPYVLMIALTEFMSLTAAVALTANLISTSRISFKWALTGLLLGNVISFSTKYIKHSLPFHLSLFGKLGVKIVLLNAAASLLLDLTIIAVVLTV